MAATLDERHSVRELLARLLGEDEAVEMEQAFLGGYKRNARHVLRLLSVPESRVWFLENIRKASASDLLEQCPRWGPVFEECKVKEAENVRANDLLVSLATREDAPSGGLSCSKCSGTNISVELYQIKSADEGTTVFCLCKDCHKRWRM